MAKNKLKQEIYKEIKEEMGGEIEEIESICESQFQFLAYTMAKGEFDGVRMSYFGRFHVNPNRVKNLNHEALQRRQLQRSD